MADQTLLNALSGYVRVCLSSGQVLLLAGMIARKLVHNVPQTLQRVTLSLGVRLRQCGRRQWQGHVRERGRIHLHLLAPAAGRPADAALAVTVARGGIACGGAADRRRRVFLLDVPA